jgi:hypothetical protein
VTEYYEPKFLPLAQRPWHSGEGERQVMVNTRTIKRIGPPEPSITSWELADGTPYKRVEYAEKRYWVSGSCEDGFAMKADLEKLGLPVPALSCIDPAPDGINDWTDSEVESLLWVLAAHTGRHGRCRSTLPARVGGGCRTHGQDGWHPRSPLLRSREEATRLQP